MRRLSTLLIAVLLGGTGVACGSFEGDSPPAPRANVRNAAAAGRAPASALSPLGGFTGARTRVVWVQDHGDGTDVIARGRQLVPMGIDTEDGLGERPILGEPGSYAKPLLTRRGDRIVFSDRHARKVFVVDWDGSTVRELVPGFALATWIDRVSRVEWVYYGSTRRGSARPAPVRRRASGAKRGGPPSGSSAYVWRA